MNMQDLKDTPNSNRSRRRNAELSKPKTFYLTESLECFSSISHYASMLVVAPLGM